MTNDQIDATVEDGSKRHDFNGIAIELCDELFIDHEHASTFKDHFDDCYRGGRFNDDDYGVDDEYLDVVAQDVGIKATDEELGILCDYLCGAYHDGADDAKSEG